MDTPVARAKSLHTPIWLRVCKAVMLLFSGAGLRLTPVQAFTLEHCKGFSETGYLECSTMQQVITPWSYMILGHGFATPFYPTEIQALEDYKAKWAAYLKTCEPITHTPRRFRS